MIRHPSALAWVGPSGNSGWSLAVVLGLLELVLLASLGSHELNTVERCRLQLLLCTIAVMWQYSMSFITTDICILKY